MRGVVSVSSTILFFFFNDTATTEIYTLSLHDALPISIHGYVALLPALYCREEFLAVVEEEDLQKAAVWLRERPNAQTIGDLAGALTFLQTAPYVTDRIGLVGFCSGGRLALIFACHSEGLRVFVNFYSNGLLQTSVVNPLPPLAMVTNLSCPMLGLFGEEDTNPSPSDLTH